MNDFTKLGAVVMGFDTSIENSFGKYEYDKEQVCNLSLIKLLLSKF